MRLRCVDQTGRLERESQSRSPRARRRVTAREVECAWRRGGPADRSPTGLREKLLALGRPEGVTGGEVPAAQGAAAPSAFPVADGVVRETGLTRPGSRPVPATLLFPGGAPGEVAAVLDEPPHLSCPAVKPTSAVASPRTDFVAFVGDRPRDAGAMAGRGSVVIDLRSSHSDLAAVIGGAPEGVGRALEKSEAEGEVEIGYRALRIEERLGPHAPSSAR